MSERKNESALLEEVGRGGDEFAAAEETEEAA